MHGEGSGPSPRHGLVSLVAREAGVSPATVSKVVHKRAGVGAKTRGRIEKILTSHGFVRPEDSHGKQIYVIFRDLAGPYTLEVARGVVDAAAANGVECVIGTISRRPIGGWLDVAQATGAIGVIIVISMLIEHDQQHAIEGNVPVVLLDPLNEPDSRIPSVGVTNWGGARTAVEHLTSLGHRRIGMVAGRPSSPAGAARLHGFKAALSEAGIAEDPTLIRSSDFDYTEGVRAARSLLKLQSPPTAIFAASDSQALGVLEAARQLNVAVPGQLSVVSFDDTAVAATSSPPLTAVRQPFEALGRVATQTLLETAAGQRPEVERVELATTLTVRQSTARWKASSTSDTAEQ